MLDGFTVWRNRSKGRKRCDDIFWWMTGTVTATAAKGRIAIATFFADCERQSRALAETLFKKSATNFKAPMLCIAGKVQHLRDVTHHLSSLGVLSLNIFQ